MTNGAPMVADQVAIQLDVELVDKAPGGPTTGAIITRRQNSKAIEIRERAYGSNCSGFRYLMSTTSLPFSP